MGIPVFILGESGSGKTSSLRNFEKSQVGIFSVAGKPLPFRGDLKEVVVNTHRYDFIKAVMAKKKRKSYVIDDSQYLMAFESFEKATELGYAKFTEMAVNFRNLIDFVINEMPDDTIVYFLHHTERSDDGHIKAKTLGKMLDNQLTVEGLFSIVLIAEASQSGYHFLTQSDGYSTAKSPIGMFADLRIDNDLEMVDETIREYWELPKNTKENVTNE